MSRKAEIWYVNSVEFAKVKTAHYIKNNRLSYEIYSKHRVTKLKFDRQTKPIVIKAKVS